MNTLDWITRLLVIIGALNWGMVGVADFNLVTTIFGTGTITTVIYVLVGLSAVWEVVRLFNK